MGAVQVRRSVQLPSTINMIEKQGILTILGSNLKQNPIPPSLRRTLSADMSSKNWLSPPMKRISSFEELATASTEVDDREELKQNMPTHDDVWRSIQSQKEQGSVWGSILSQNKDNNQTPHYVHPLLRKSTSNLSQKSLEVCTESLGSETGSDGFSFYPHPESNVDKIHEKEERNEPEIQRFEDFHVAKYNYNPTHKKVAHKKSFPPPLPSLSNRSHGCTSLQMQSHRKNGRLVLEAVSVPQQNNFHVDRQEGRLVLTLINNDPQAADFQQVFDTSVEFDNEDGFEGHKEEMTIMIENNSASFQTSGMLNIPMMKSFLGMGKKDTVWSNKMNKVVEFMEAEQVVGKLRTATAATRPAPSMASFNVYEYLWRRNHKTSVTEIIGSTILTQQCSWNNDKDVLAKQEVVIMRGNKGDYFAPLLVWQPHCIATS